MSTQHFLSGPVGDVLSVFLSELQLNADRGLWKYVVSQKYCILLSHVPPLVVLQNRLFLKIFS